MVTPTVPVHTRVLYTNRHNIIKARRTSFLDELFMQTQERRVDDAEELDSAATLVEHRAKLDDLLVEEDVLLHEPIRRDTVVVVE